MTFPRRRSACARWRACSWPRATSIRRRVDAIVETYEHEVGPHLGARVVARAWVDPAFRERLRANATDAVAELGICGRAGEHLVAVFNTPEVHNLVVCTLCSCYPWTVLGLPPVWYKSAPYRSRAVSDPRGVLADFGVTLARRRERPRVGLDRPRSATSWCRCRRPATSPRTELAGDGHA